MCIRDSVKAQDNAAPGNTYAGILATASCRSISRAKYTPAKMNQPLYWKCKKNKTVERYPCSDSTCMNIMNASIQVPSEENTLKNRAVLAHGKLLDFIPAVAEKYVAVKI